MVTAKMLRSLPGREDLRKLCQSLATLDAIFEPEWEYRYCSFDLKYGAGESLGSMRNGAGDEYFVFFNRRGVIIKGFDHESEMNICDGPEKVWRGVLDEVPGEFEDFLNDPAFPPEYTTFCLWRPDSENAWKTGKIRYPRGDPEADGSDWLLFLLDGKPETYRDWAEDYYEREIDLETVDKIYRQKPLTEEMVNALNPKRRFADLKKELEEIGYPF